MYLDSATHKAYIKKPIDVSVTLTVIQVVGHCNSRVIIGYIGCCHGNKRDETVTMLTWFKAQYMYKCYLQYLYNYILMYIRLCRNNCYHGITTVGGIDKSP